MTATVQMLRTHEAATPADEPEFDLELNVLPAPWFPDRKAVREFFEGDRFDVICFALGTVAWPRANPDAWLDANQLDSARQATRLIAEDLSKLGAFVGGDGPIKPDAETQEDQSTDFEMPKSVLDLRTVVFTAAEVGPEYRATVEEVFRELLGFHEKIAEAHEEQKRSGPLEVLAKVLRRVGDARDDADTTQPAQPPAEPASVEPNGESARDAPDQDNGPADSVRTALWTACALVESGDTGLGVRLILAVLNEPEQIAEHVGEQIDAQEIESALRRMVSRLAEAPPTSDEVLLLMDALKVAQGAAQVATPPPAADEPEPDLWIIPDEVRTPAYLAWELADDGHAKAAASLLAALMQGGTRDEIVEMIGEALDPSTLDAAMRHILEKGCRGGAGSDEVLILVDALQHTE